MATKKEEMVQEPTTPRKWVVDWQNKNPSVIVDMTATGKARKERRLTGDEDKFAWVDDELQPGDELYILVNDKEEGGFAAIEAIIKK